VIEGEPLVNLFGSIRRLALTLAVAATLTVPAIAAAQDATPAPYAPGTDLGALGGSITSDGSSTVFPIMEALAEEFGLQAEGVEVIVDLSGTGGGFKRFCAGETDLSNASRAIKDEEIALCAENGVNYYEFEIAYDGLSVVVNPENDWVTCLTVDQLAQMWGPDASGTLWSDIDPSWPAEEIELYGPGTDSGTYDYFTAEVNGEEGVSTTDYTPSEDDNVLVEGVAGSSNALGFFGLSYYEQNADRLKLVEIDGGSGCIAPSQETVQDGSYAPLSRPLFVYVNAESLARPEVQEFLRYSLAEVGTFLPEVGYVASPGQVYAADQAKLESAIAGAATPDGPVAAEATPSS
jgi:phosphate transport system substrate-binding protein